MYYHGIVFHHKRGPKSFDLKTAEYEVYSIYLHQVHQEFVTWSGTRWIPIDFEMKEAPHEKTTKIECFWQKMLKCGVF